MAKFTSQEVKALQEGGNQVYISSPPFFSLLVTSVTYVMFFTFMTQLFNFFHPELVSVVFMQRAKEVLLKEWDPQRQSFPDSRLLLLILCSVMCINDCYISNLLIFCQ